MEKQKETLEKFEECMNEMQTILADHGIPSVMVLSNKNSASNHMDHIHLGTEVGIREAVLHLHENNRKRIAYIGEANTTSTELFFREAITVLEQPIEEQYIYRSPFRFSQAGTDGFKVLFSLKKPPDAVICAYDYIAFGVLNAAYFSDVQVPEQLAVIGMNNIRATENYRMGLTTIGTDYQRLCDTLVELLIRRIRNPNVPVQQISVEQHLIVRETG